MPPLRHMARLRLPLALLTSVVGCIEPKTTTRRSGLMDYLYPKRKEAPTPNPAEARLRLPLRLGIAFVPSRGQDLSIVQERPLLETVRTAFKDKPWIQEMKLIPSSYLSPSGGFDNLDQVARMYAIDVIALVSVDQIQYTNPKWYSFAYLSIVGAYVLPGETNDTRTLIDAAVFDISTRTFLFRAPGQSVVKGSSSWVNREEKLRKSAEEGLRLAMDQLSRNLAGEVDAFKAEVASGARRNVDVIDHRGQSLRQTGGRGFSGGLGLLEAALGLALVALVRRRRP